MIQDPLHLATLILSITALGFWLETRFKWAAKIGASLLIIVLGAFVSNLNLVPIQSAVYDVIYGPITSLAIVWLLFAVDFNALRTAGPGMLAGFGVALLGTMLGSLTAVLLFNGLFPEQGWKLAGVMTGTYSGGSLNFVSVGRGLDMSDVLFTAATASDNVMTAVWFGVTLTLPVWAYRRFGGGQASAKGKEGGTACHPMADVPLKISDLCMLGALGFAVLTASGWVASLMPNIPSVIWLTTIALIVARVPAIRKLSGALPLGSIALHLFFVLIGIGSKFSEIARVGPGVFYFTAVVVIVHGLVIYGIAYWRKMDWDTVSTASQAAVGGPSTAMALAVSRGKPDLALPGVAVGLLGYGVGTYLGFAIAYLTKALLY